MPVAVCAESSIELVSLFSPPSPPFARVNARSNVTLLCRVARDELPFFTFISFHCCAIHYSCHRHSIGQ